MALARRLSKGLSRLLTRRLDEDGGSDVPSTAIIWGTSNEIVWGAGNYLTWG